METLEKPSFSFDIAYDKPNEEMTQIGQQQVQTITMKNLVPEGKGMSLAIVSIPSSMKVDFNQLTILKDSKQVNHYEVSPDGSQIVFYWTYMKADEVKEVKLTRVVHYAGDGSHFTNRQSRAYMYYEDTKVLYQY